MNEILKEIENLFERSFDKHLDSDSILGPDEKKVVNHRFLKTDRTPKETCRYYINPLDYGIPIWQLRMYSEQHLFCQEINSVFEEDDIKLSEKLSNKELSLFKIVLRESYSPIELYISGRNARLIFGVSIRRLRLYRETDVIKVAKYKGSYCYSWIQLQELFG